ncbi:MAG: cupin domain-containing protein, partial [Alphaproteobacteria bacterium]
KFEAALTAEEASGLFDITRLQEIISGPGKPATQTDIYRIQNIFVLSDVMRGSGRTAADLAEESLKIGCTLRFRDADQFDRRLAEFAREVAGNYAAEAQVNVYFTPPRQEGFPPHFDNSDSFIVQVAGAKDWLIHPDYTDRQTLPGPDVDWDPGRFRPVGSAEAHVMRVGDVLYIPRGVMHSARCRDEESMHLTVTLTSLTMLSLLERELRRLAAGDEALRRRAAWSVAGGADEGEAIRRELQRLLGVLADKADPSVAIEEKRAVLAKAAEPLDLFAKTVASLKPR